jgi:2-dehydropantoate 2-reductase
MIGSDFSRAEAVSVAVLGAGALGSLYGALLALAGCRVTLVGRGNAHAAAINEHGLSLEQVGDAASRHTARKIRAVTQLREADPPDLLILLVKSYDTATALSGCARDIPPGCRVLTLQNGLGNLEAMAEFLPPERLLAGVCYIGASLPGPGRVLYTGPAPTVLGSPFVSADSGNGAVTRPQLVNLCALFSQAGLLCTPSEDIVGEIWTKMLLNAATNPLAALTRQNNIGVTAAPESQALMAALLDEIVLVARAKGIDLKVDDPLAHVRRMGELSGRTKGSMLQDVLAGRRTEILSMNGAIVREGAALGLPVPFNAAITSLILLLEKGYLAG